MLLERTDEAGAQILWPLERLRALTDQSGKDQLILTLLSESGDETPREPARLVVSDPDAIAWFRQTRPGLFRRDVRRGTFRRVALWLGGAAAAVLLMLFVILPRLTETLAARIPADTEARFGRAMIAQVESFLGAANFGSLDCKGVAGVAALDRLKARLTTDQDIGYDIELLVLDHDMVNAFALPGGHIVILKGLLSEAKSPDDVAGVLSQELGHVARRDPIRLTLRAAGSAGILSLLLGDVTGGTIIALAGDHLMQASYTREAEAAADDYAFALLDDAQISSEPFAGFFDRIAGDTDVIPKYLSSHPLSADRAEKARRNAEAASGAPQKPALSPADWAALQGICEG